jgi:hypothetical protein
MIRIIKSHFLTLYWDTFRYLSPNILKGAPTATVAIAFFAPNFLASLVPQALIGDQRETRLRMNNRRLKEVGSQERIAASRGLYCTTIQIRTCFCLPPVECCKGVSPTQAAKSRRCLKVSAGRLGRQGRLRSPGRHRDWSSADVLTYLLSPARSIIP